MFFVTVEKCTMEKDELLFSVEFEDEMNARLYADKLSLDYQKENPDFFDDDGNLVFENPYTVFVSEK